VVVSNKKTNGVYTSPSLVVNDYELTTDSDWIFLGVFRDWRLYYDHTL